MIKKFYWSPSAVWYIDSNNQLIINNDIYSQELALLFPKFYYLTVQGSLTTELLHQYIDHDANMVRNFINVLLNNKVLVHTIDDVSNIFTAQSRLFKQHNTFDNQIRVNPTAKKEFTNQSLKRDIIYTQSPIALESVDIEDSIILGRKSTRKFNTKEVISFKQFSGLLSILKERLVDNKSQYNFASGGGLYPIDYYIYIKENRVENLPQGIYLYVPYANELRMVSVTNENFKDAHYFANQDIFEGSAFSIYLIYNAMYSMPKYDGLGYYLGIVDSGIISHTLTMSAEFNGLGSCIIGEMNFNLIREFFKLNETQTYLHCIEFGLKDKEN